MDEEFDTGVDTSDVDTSADMDTSDVVDDVPEDIPEDVPEDIPEDIPEDESEAIEEDDLSEDIPEDIPEKEPEAIEEDDLSDGIPEDVSEDEPEMIEEDDMSEDILEDIPEEEPEALKEDDLSEDILEDIPEEEAEALEEDDLSEDIPEDVPEDEPEAIEEDDLSNDIPEDVPEDEPEAVEENDLSDDVPEDVPEDQVETDDTTTDETAEDTTSDVDNGDFTEPIEETQDELLDDTTTDEATEDAVTDEVTEEIASETERTDSAKPAEDIQDELLDDTTTDEAAEDTTSYVDNGDTTETTEDTQDESLNDVATDKVAEGTTMDVDDADSTEQVKDNQDEQSNEQGTNDDASEIPVNEESLSNDTTDAMNGLSDYMNNHNYGPDDFDKYSQDPEWRDLQKKAFPDYELPPLSKESAYNQLSDYMNEHNYGIDDFDTYSQDSKWRELQGAAFPDYELPPLNETTEDIPSDVNNGDPTEFIDDIRDEPMDDTATEDTAEDTISDVENGDSAEPTEDSQDEKLNDSTTENLADGVGTTDNTNDTSDINEVNNLSDKVSYLDRIKGNAENALAYDPERKGDWDVIRGRLSDEYRQTSNSLKALAEGKQAEYNQLRNEYFDMLESVDSPEKSARLEELRNRRNELSKEIETANSRSRYADNFANELSRDLDPSKRTTYEGVGGKSFTDLHQSMIQKQGNAVKDFKGTCGDCSAANTMTALGDTKSEAEVVQRARDLNACVDKKIPSFLPESMKEKMRGKNGGTSVAGRTQILDSFGYDCDNRTNQSLSEIAQQIENGKGAIINVDHRVLNKQRDVTAMNPIGTDHALTITGIEKDAAGNPIGLWIHDTGVCSNMGNAFYCNAQDYATWKNTPNCTVQYVSKK